MKMWDAIKNIINNLIASNIFTCNLFSPTVGHDFFPIRSLNYIYQSFLWG